MTGVPIGARAIILSGRKTIGGNDANTKMLLHCDGNFTDSSASGNTASASGSVSTSSSQFKFGTQSMSQSGSAGHLDCPSGVLNVGTDYTLDWWFYLSANVSGQDYYTCCKGTNTYGPFSFYIGGGNTMSLYLGNTGSSWNIASPLGNATISLTTWHHIAFVHSGTNYYWFIDGTLNSSTGSGAANLQSNSNSLSFGGGTNNASCGGVQSYFDEIRVSNVARWTSGFTPASGPYS